MKRDSIGGAGLKVGESSKLFGIAEEKFNLKPRRIIVINRVRRQGRIRREEQRREQVRARSFRHIDEANSPLERDTVDDGGIEGERVGQADRRQRAEIVAVDRASIALTCAPAFRMGADKERAQPRIMAEPTDQMEAEVTGTARKFVIGVGPIDRQIVDICGETRAVGG